MYTFRRRSSRPFETVQSGSDCIPVTYGENIPGGAQTNKSEARILKSNLN